MRYHKHRYLSVRIFFLCAAFALFVLILLAGFTINTIQQDGYIIVPIIGIIIFSILVYGGYRWVYLAYKDTKKVLELFSAGFTMQGIYELRYPLTPEMDHAILKFRSILDANELIGASQKQAQYLALQNQINPHFLYNTLEGIRGEAVCAGLGQVAEMTEALATFFRYTISNVDRLVLLEEELSNVENYYIIQQYRFGNRIHFNIEYDGTDRLEANRCRLPKLTLQPIVENAILHGIERKIGDGTINIKVEVTSCRLIITVSDDGLGMERTKLQKLENKLHTQSLNYIKLEDGESGGIAIVNVNNRLRLLFGEEYGINLYSTVGVGTDVEIMLPVIADETKEI